MSSELSNLRNLMIRATHAFSNYQAYGITSSLSITEVLVEAKSQIRKKKKWLR